MDLNLVDLPDLNPLDWTAAPFLTLYVLVAAATLLWIRDRSNNLGPRDGADTAGLDPVQIGFLAGGAARATDAALVGLVQARAAALRDGTVWCDPTVPVPAALAPFRYAGGDRAAFHAAHLPRCGRVRDGLVRRGLVPDAATLAAFRSTAWPVLGLPLALGLAKVAVGVGRDRPVGILCLLLAGTALLGARLVLRFPSRTAAGTAALARLRRQQSRATRAPLPNEAALAFALTGTVAVLADADVRAFLRQNAGASSDSSSGDSSSDSGSSGDGGGGCGGCSG